jgi:phage terminase Nu1 subunit (DNA packaging protein)
MRKMSQSAYVPTLLAGLITRDQLRAELGCSARTVVRHEMNGLPVIRRGNLRLYEIDKVRAWLLARAA